MSEVFLDTSFAIALITKKDKHHQRAKEMADDFEHRRTRFVTTRAVLLEIGNAFSKSPLRRQAVIEGLPIPSPRTATSTKPVSVPSS